jgi:hypothetical protein
MGILDYSTTPGSNTTINGIGISGGSSIKYGNDAIMQFMADVRVAVTKSTDKAAGTYMAAKADHNQLWRVTGDATINLTSAATLTAGWALWVMADGGTATIDPAGSEKINGADTLTLTSGNSAFIVCTATAFRAIIFNAAATLGDAAYLDVGTTAGTVAAGDDARLSDAREWTAATVSQAEAEAGTATDRRAWTAERVKQAIAANGSPPPDYGAGNAALAVGAVGTYALMACSGTSAVSTGGTVAGSQLTYANVNSGTGGSPSGTWRCMGNITTISGGTRITVFLRIS